MRGGLQAGSSWVRGVASTGLVHRLIGEVVLLDTEVAREGSGAMMERSALHDATSTLPSTSYSCTRSNDVVRGMSTSVTVCANSEDSETLDELRNKHRDMREDFQEKQSNYRAEFEKVKELPQPTKQQWWRPDPETGMWVPVDYEGEVTTSTSNHTPRQSRVRTESPDSLEDKRWWTSMEELPDIYRSK